MKKIALKSPKQILKQFWDGQSVMFRRHTVGTTALKAVGVLGIAAGAPLVAFAGAALLVLDTCLVFHFGARRPAYDAQMAQMAAQKAASAAPAAA